MHYYKVNFAQGPDGIAQKRIMVDGRPDRPDFRVRKFDIFQNLDSIATRLIVTKPGQRSFPITFQSQRTYVTRSVWQRAICYNLWWFYNIWSVSHWVELGKSASGNVYKIKSVLWRGLSDGIFILKLRFVQNRLPKGSNSLTWSKTQYITSHVSNREGTTWSHDPIRKIGQRLKTNWPSWSFPLCVFGKFKFF